MTHDQLREFIHSLPPIPNHGVDANDPDISQYTRAYRGWRRRQPKKGRVPTIAIGWKLEGDRFEIDKLLFPLRAAPYSGKRQMKTDTTLFEANEQDRALLRAFQQYVTSVNGTLNIDALEFGCLKENLADAVEYVVL